ncbi:MAG: hypothetical protein HQ567_23490 [Candidatus Nealsonbacteria bacterium]|nr:hypothetical protein [Candidatus Nealsonbacteria bacterium]
MPENPYHPPATSSPEQRPPARMKVWGLFWMYRSSYLTLQSIVFITLAALVAVRCLFEAPEIALQTPFRQTFWEYLGWGAVVIAILEVGETLVVLGKFKAAEASND